MRSLFVGASILAVLGMFATENVVYGQQEWGSLSGKATLNGKIPPIVDLKDKMKLHPDKSCCLAPKAKTLDETWIVDPKTSAVKNVFVYLRPPQGKEFPIHPKLLKRKEIVEIDQPNCVFVPRVQAFQPFHYIDGKEVLSGQKMYVKNSASVSHNVNIVGGGEGKGINVNLPAGEELNLLNFFKGKKPQLAPFRLPYDVSCGVHAWMAGKLFVFDNPYHAITKDDGSYEIPYVPAGTDVSVMAWHEGVGYVLTSKGKTMKLQPGKNTLDIEVVSPNGPK